MPLASITQVRIRPPHQPAHPLDASRRGTLQRRRWSQHLFHQPEAARRRVDDDDRVPATASRRVAFTSTTAELPPSRGEIYKWELEKGDESVAIAVSGSLVLDDEDLVIQAALDGAGLALVADIRATAHPSGRALIRVMEDWTPPFPGFFLHYPPPKTAAVIDTLVEVMQHG